jgi:hypothetical protein
MIGLWGLVKVCYMFTRYLHLYINNVYNMFKYKNIVNFHTVKGSNIELTTTGIR